MYQAKENFISTIRDFKVSPKRISNEIIFDISHVKSCLEIIDIDKIYEIYTEHPDLTQTEKIMIYINKTYDLTLYNAFEFINNLIKIDLLDSLKIIGADKIEYFYYMSIEEALERILTFLFKENNSMPSKNGFPVEFNVNQSNIPFNFNGNIIFPYTELNETYSEILSNILENLNINEDNLFFHGTNWVSALSIINWIEIFEHISDFGKKNFYLSNNFKSAFKWAKTRGSKCYCCFSNSKRIY